MNAVEICLASDDEVCLASNVAKVYQAGAERIELCSAMSEHGLTPTIAAISIARKEFADRPGLMVMIRPRAGDFCYNTQEIALMRQQINQAAKAGADGVVFGALTSDGTSLDLVVCKQLIDVAQNLKLEVGIHRAFDAVIDSQQALAQLITLGVERVLSSGTPWGENSTALVGLPRLLKLVTLAQQKIEIVIAGSVTPENAKKLLNGFDKIESRVSLHAYSSVLQGEHIDTASIDALINT